MWCLLFLFVGIYCLPPKATRVFQRWIHRDDARETSCHLSGWVAEQSLISCGYLNDTLGLDFNSNTKGFFLNILRQVWVTDQLLRRVSKDSTWWLPGFGLVVWNYDLPLGSWDSSSKPTVSGGNPPSPSQFRDRRPYGVMENGHGQDT